MVPFPRECQHLRGYLLIKIHQLAKSKLHDPTILIKTIRNSPKPKRKIALAVNKKKNVPHYENTTSKCALKINLSIRERFPQSALYCNHHLSYLEESSQKCKIKFYIRKKHFKFFTLPHRVLFFSFFRAADIEFYSEKLYLNNISCISDIRKLPNEKGKGLFVRQNVSLIF